MRSDSCRLSRRDFVRQSGALGGLLAFGPLLPAIGPGNEAIAAAPKRRADREIRIADVDADFEREPLIRPFGFKGGFMTEIWQAAALLEGESGAHAIGLGTQNVLWSDSSVFAAHTESGGNALMYALTERALQMVKGTTFATPIDLQEQILEELYAYGKRLTGNPELSETFVLNALIAVDNAAWLLYAKENGVETFDEMIPAPYRPGFGHHHDAVAMAPSIAYTIPPEEMQQAVDDGFFFMKIKLGQPGTQQEMLEKDLARMSLIHETIGSARTTRTASGRLPYYLDFNMRYESRDTLMRLLDHIEAIGAADQVVIVEDPFPGELKIDVSGLGFRFAADEPAHTEEGARERIALGYEAIALKPIAKTLSMTMKIVRVAHENGVPCFCADLTVNPILVDWNKNVAARMAPLPGLNMGLMESNGHQNYLHWDRMMGYHPMAGAPWTEARNGVWELGDAFYRSSGGILLPSPHYESMFGRG